MNSAVDTSLKFQLMMSQGQRQTSPLRPVAEDASDSFPEKQSVIYPQGTA